MSTELNSAFIALVRARQALRKHGGSALSHLPQLEQVRETALSSLKTLGIEVRDDFADIPKLLSKITKQVEALTLLQDAVEVHSEIVKAAVGAPAVQNGVEENEDDEFDLNEFNEPDLPPVPKHRRW